MFQIACKLSPESKATVTNLRSEAFFIFSRDADTSFLPGEAENTSFTIERREQQWHFRLARQKIIFIELIIKKDYFKPKKWLVPVTTKLGTVII